MYSIRKGIIFDNLDPKLQESLKNIGFHDGDDISKMFQDFLDKKNVTLDEYISNFYYVDLEEDILHQLKVATTAMTTNKDVDISKSIDYTFPKISKIKKKNIFSTSQCIMNCGGDEYVRFAV